MTCQERSQNNKAMFLDEELEQIYKENVQSDETSENLYKAMINRLSDINKQNPLNFLAELKQIDNAWRLFCKRHPGEYEPEGFRNSIRKADKDGKFIKALNW